MSIEVTNRAQLVDALLRGATLWCLDTGEGWQLCGPGELPHPHFRSKRGVRRFVSFLYNLEQNGHNPVRFGISWE